MNFADEKKIKLYCFPFAGGSSSFYHAWHKLLPSFIDLQPYELPGRGMRMAAELCGTIDDVVDDVMNTIGSELQTEPYAFFGHSMGGLIAHELTRRVHREGLPAPMITFISGKGDPTFARRKVAAHNMSEDTFKDYLVSLGGVSDEFFKNPDLVSFFMPMIVNDLKLVEDYVGGPIEPYDTDLITLFGKGEAWTDEERKGWSRHTTGKTQQFTFPGGHFFIKNYFPEITRIITQMLHHQLMS
jgi:medium-chain acyl-[acyl-carrier-protein] hydrolase